MKWLVFVAAVLGCACLSCSQSRIQLAESQTGGDCARGREKIAYYGCGSCHTIPGVSGANGLVGPPLSGIGNRAYIAGVLPNESANMIRWIRDPQAVDKLT